MNLQVSICGGDSVVVFTAFLFIDFFARLINLQMIQCSGVNLFFFLLLFLLVDSEFFLYLMKMQEFRCSPGDFFSCSC